jgi:DNA-directed RNA polymerase II subunit RPB2
MSASMNSWDAIRSYFEDSHLERLVQHQVESYNEFVTQQIQQTIDQFNPIVVHSDQFYDATVKKYKLEVWIRFTNFQMNLPQINENNGSTKVMFPQEARLRNFTYASTTTIDLNIQYFVRSGPLLEETQCFNNVIKQIHIGKIPIMLKSSACVLTHYSHLDCHTTGECRYDPGGYFIINGSEKTVLGQERTAENKIYCFPASNSQKHLFQAEIKCTPDTKRISPKQINLYILKTSSGDVIQVNLPRVRKYIPIGIVFRAMGILSDKEICKFMSLNKMDDEILELIRPSIVESSTCLTQEEAIHYISSQVMYNTFIDKSSFKKPEVVEDVLSTDFFSHCKTSEQKIYMLGYMAHKLIQCSLGRTPCDDRDSYLNKRIGLTGSLLNDLYRNYFNKMVKDMQKQIIREMNTGSWKSREDYNAIITYTNVYKLIRSTTIENGLKRALSTGDFGIKQMNTNKVGVAQVLNRLTYASSLSHLRRINTPVAASGKLVAPRKLSNSTWGFLCPAETPEGQSVGLVKNMAIMAHITVRSDSTSLYKQIGELEPLSLDAQFTKVFINGTWIGCTKHPESLYTLMKFKKYSSIISIYTSIVFDYNANEILICNDPGRLVRPLFKVSQQKILYTPEIATLLREKKITWDDLLISHTRESIIEYIDPTEQNSAMISMTKELDSKSRYTHCEIDPSTIFGVLASCIPFPEHNQSPRNTYQCAMGKQAIGIYVTNYQERMDKTAWILNTPGRPIVDTRVMQMLKLNDLPSGMTVIVAIMTHTGYNQEDSVMINQGAIDRGLFRTTAFHTEKEEDKRTGDEEIRCKPDPHRTKGMKFSNYSKIGLDGVMPVNTEIENMDIIMGKVTPIKEARNDLTKTIKYEDTSKYFRTDETCYMDRNHIGINGEGYTSWKCRIRSDRIPEIGDKFSSRHGQKGTVGNIIPEVDLPFTAEGLKPDIIINPHAIPSRMTIGQLKETLLGKVLLELGIFGDGTAFTDLSITTIADELIKLGYESTGNELMYNAMTGEQMESSIFIGPCFYQRLKHMVIDKQHSRSLGPAVGLTRQPAEGRARDGGLRFGEMERDCMISHGASYFTKGRMYDASDAFKIHVCKKCGMIASHNDAGHIHLCKLCDNRTDFSMVKLPYACKLLFHELITMNVAPRMITR